MSNATIDDVAALAGVSMKTVSRVMNNEPNVRPSTRERVQAAVAELSYRPNMSARSLAGNKSYVLGLLYGVPSAHYVLDIQEGVLDICRPLGYELLVHPCNYQDQTLIDDVLELVRNKRIDGIMVTPPISDHMPLLSDLKSLGVPFVRVAPTEQKDLSPYVETNDLDATYEMTHSLIELGHKRIGFICGDPDHRAVARRFEGYKSAIEAQGLRVEVDLIAQGNNRFESGEACANRFLEMANPPTAILAATDDMAAGAMICAHKLGIKIPQELSVAGFDDTPVAQKIWPAMTTVRQPIQQMAKKATEMLIKQLRGKADEIVPCSLPSRLVMRASTGQAPKKSTKIVG